MAAVDCWSRREKSLDKPVEIEGLAVKYGPEVERVADGHTAQHGQIRDRSVIVVVVFGYVAVVVVVLQQNVEPGQLQHQFADGTSGRIYLVAGKPDLARRQRRRRHRRRDVRGVSRGVPAATVGHRLVVRRRHDGVGKRFAQKNAGGRRDRGISSRAPVRPASDRPFDVHLVADVPPHLDRGGHALGDVIDRARNARQEHPVVVEAREHSAGGRRRPARRLRPRRPQREQHGGGRDGRHGQREQLIFAEHRHRRRRERHQRQNIRYAASRLSLRRWRLQRVEDRILGTTEDECARESTGPLQDTGAARFSRLRLAHSLSPSAPLLHTRSRPLSPNNSPPPQTRLHDNNNNNIMNLRRYCAIGVPICWPVPTVPNYTNVVRRYCARYVR